MVTEKISNLLSEYFDLAFAEGKEGRNHDTEAGDAQRVLSELEAALSTDAEPVAEKERLRFEGDLDKWMKSLGAGISGYQPEAYAVMDAACAELVKLRALSTDAEPVMYVSEKQLAQCVGHYVPSRKTAEGNFQLALYRAPPAPSLAVKTLQWDEDGDNLKARMGDREWMLNITADGKTWAGSTRPFVFGRNLTWSSVPNCSFLPLEEAKAACQADCQSSYAALSAQVQDVAVEAPIISDELATDIIFNALVDIRGQPFLDTQIHEAMRECAEVWERTKSYIAAPATE